VPAAFAEFLSFGLDICKIKIDENLQSDIYYDVCRTQRRQRLRGFLRLYAQKLFLTLMLVDMGLGGLALQVWKSDS
jgi:hypothetical protein